MPTIMEKPQWDEVGTKMNMGEANLETGTLRRGRSNKIAGVIQKSFS